MTAFTDLLSEKGKENWALLYKKLTGKKWIPPKRSDRAIKCEPKLESLEEIDKLMRKVPGSEI